MKVLKFLRLEHPSRPSQQTVCDEVNRLLPEPERFSQVRYSEFERGLDPRPAQLAAIATYFGLPASLADILMRDVDDALTNAVPDPPDLRASILAARSAQRGAKR